jgi:capsular exopolysaccharide synthesis family protein
MQDQRLATILWRGKWLILAAVAVGIALAILITKTTAKVYSATATIQANVGSSAASGTTNPIDQQLANQNLALTYATRITDRSFLEQIRPRVLGGDLSTSQLESRLSSKAITNTSLFQLTAEGPSESRARALAASVANAFVGTVQRESTAQANSLQSKIQERIRALDTQISKARSPETLASLRGARSELERQLAQTVAGQIAQGNSVGLTAPPTGPSSPVRPRPVLNLIAGVLLGLLFGVALAWLRVRLDRGLHSADEAEELLGVPTLASIPVRRRFSNDDAVLGEAFDVLRANLAFLSHDQNLHVITFSSFNPREGKSSTVEGLAHAAVRGALNVLVIDGDSRTSALSTRLGHGSSAGLTNVIVGMANIDDTVVEILPGLSLLPSGPLPPNPPSLLSSGRMRELLADVRDRYSLILIDSPPVAHLADASILASMSDGVIVVSRVGLTKRADLPAAAANLRQVPTPIVGVVVLEQRQIDDTYYPALSRGGRPATPEDVRASADAVETF